MRSIIKRASKTVLASIGLEVKRTGKGLIGKLAPTDKYIFKINGHPLKFTASDEDRFKWLQNMDIKTIIDVGAHTGEFALEIHQILPKAKIYSFEPLHDCFAELRKNFAKFPNFKAFNVALSDREQGQEYIYHNKFSACSSILEVGESLKTSLPFAQDTKLELINVDTLDRMATQLDFEDNILLKIDVQGLEDKVIYGGIKTLKRINILIVELSFIELYKGQPLFGDVYRILTDLGFKYGGSWAQQKSPIDGSPYQEDSIFLKK